MKCPICNGIIVETDKYGTEQECEYCGTVYRLLPMERTEDGTND